MRFMVLVKGNAESEAGIMPSQEILEAMTEYNEELVKNGVMLAGEGLHPTSRGVKIRFDGSKKTVIDGPFAETKEIVAGFWLIQARDLAEAVEWHDALSQIMPSPVVELNRAVAVGIAYGPAAGLALVEGLGDEPALQGYHLLPSVRADLLFKLGRLDEARGEFERAALLTRNEAERALLLARAAACRV